MPSLLTLNIFNIIIQCFCCYFWTCFCILGKIFPISSFWPSARNEKLYRFCSMFLLQRRVQEPGQTSEMRYLGSEYASVLYTTAWKVSIFGVFLSAFFCMQTEYGPEKFRIWTLFQAVYMNVNHGWTLIIRISFTECVTQMPTLM